MHMPTNTAHAHSFSQRNAVARSHGATLTRQRVSERLVLDMASVMSQVCKLACTTTPQFPPPKTTQFRWAAGREDRIGRLSL